MNSILFLAARSFLFLIMLLVFSPIAHATVTNVAWYRLGENDPGAASGRIANSTTVDFVGANHLRRFGNQRYINAVAPDAARIGSSLAVQFRGANEFYSNTVATTARDNFGLEAWVRVVTTSNGTFLIAFNGNAAANGWGLAVEVTNRFSRPVVTYFGRVARSATLVGFNTASSRDGWTHVALVRDNGTNTLYLNGVASSATSTATPLTPAGAFAIAADPFRRTSFFPGLIDEMRVFTFAPGQFSPNDLLVNQAVATTLPENSPAPGTVTLNGSASSVGFPTTVWFEWGPTTNLGNVTPPRALGSGFTGTNYSETLTGLAPGSYRFRAVGSNQLGTIFGDVRLFLMGQTVQTLPASGVTQTAATLNGVANPRGTDTSVRFEWGLTTNYGNLTAPRAVGNGGNNTNFSETLLNLFPAGTFHYRAVATSPFGTLAGANQTFQTPSVTSGDLAVLGAVTVSIQPPGAVADGASWMLDNGPFQLPGLPHPSVTPGPHTVRFRDLPNWIEPRPIEVVVVGGRVSEASVVFAPLPVFDFRSIPEQHARHGETLEFLVRDGTSIAPFQITALPPVTGAIAYDAATGRVAYTPGTGDRLPFTLTFTNSGQSATALITPLPDIPNEDIVIGYDRPLPNDESRDYISISENLNPPELFNNFTNQTFTVDISGKTLVFDANHPARLFQQYSGRHDIKEFRLFADRVIIRSALRLPQTRVAIHARELRFEGNGVLDTTPRSQWTRPRAVEWADDNVIGFPGSAGHPGGDADIFVERFHADPTPAIRFILRGGDGGPPGEGRNGVFEGGGNPVFFPGFPVNPNDVNFVANSNWMRLTARAGNPANCGLSNNRLRFYSEFRNNGVLNPNLTCGSQTIVARGEPAVPSGVPGAGGRGGILRSTLNLAAHTDLTGGVAGTNGGNYVGGTLVYQYVYEFINNVTVGPNPGLRVSYTQAPRVPGANATAPTNTNGVPGSVVVVVNPASWLHSFSVRGVLQFVRDAYLNERITEARALLVSYRDAIRGLQPAVDPNSVTNLSEAEFAETTSLDQLAQEIDTLIHRIDSNLDFFGNPAGWVPMLSFEANLTAFEQEVEQSIPVLYLAHWLSYAATNLQDSLAASTEAVAKLRDELGRMVVSFNQTQLLIPALKTDSAILSQRIAGLQARLLFLEQELLARAQQNLEERNKLPFWKKALGVLSVAADLVPIGQPTIGRIGAGLGVLANVDPSKPLSSLQANKTNIFAITSNKDFRLCFTNSPPCTNACTPEAIAAAQAKELKFNSTCAKFLGDELEELGKLFKDVQVDSKALAAELEKLKAADPVFKAVTEELAQLNKDKERLAQQLAAALQAVNTLLAAMTQNSLSTHQLEQRIARAITALDHNALLHIKEMERRAKDRLLKFQYFVAKAFQYRLLQPYNGNLQLTRIFDRFQALVAANSHVLSPAEFTNLKALYVGELREIVSQTLAPLNANAPERSQPASFNLVPEELERLNRDGRLVINLRDKGFFASGHENIRIVDLRTSRLQVRPVGGTIGGFALCFVDFEHQGVSRLTRSGESFLFRHYQTEAVNPITWNALFDGVAQTVTQSVPSPAVESLIRTLIDQPNDDKLLLFSRPAADAEILITKTVSTDNGIDLVIDAVSIQVQYEFFNTSSSRSELTVNVTDALEPVITLSQTDLNGRRDGLGDFRRVYPVGATVTLQAPASYGGRPFDRWLVNRQPRAAGAASLTLALTAPTLAEASYGPIPPTGIAPFIVQQPANTAATVGSTVVFTANAGGSEPLFFRWRRDGTPLTNGGRITGATNATLVISNLALTDAAAYDVVVSNAFGARASQAALLTVTAPAVSLLPASPGSVGFEFPTTVGLRYIIERKFRLNDLEWTVVATMDGNGEFMQFTRSTSAETAFFRLRVEEITP